MNATGVNLHRENGVPAQVLNSSRPLSRNNFLSSTVALVILSGVNDSPHSPLTFYQPPTKLRESNIFNRVCLSVCSQKGWNPCTEPQLPTCTGPHAPLPPYGPSPTFIPRTGPWPQLPSTNRVPLPRHVQTCSI